jgi:hypothetical protein
MSLALVAEPDLRERVRCIRVIASESPLSAIGAATWEELNQTFEGADPVALVFYTPSLPGAPEDAIARLTKHTARLVLAVDGWEGGQVDGPTPPGVSRVTWPIAEETLVLLARAAGAPLIQPRMSFMPVDFLQMICMSGDSHVLVLSEDGADVGVIEVRNGQVWTAFDSLGVGEEAFARLIRPETRARLGPANVATKERTLFKDLQELVLESLRRIDEGSVRASPPPLSPAQLEVALSSPEQLKDRVRLLNAEARRLLMERRYDDAARVLVGLSELDPASNLVRANLEQLRKLGYPR